MTTVDQFIATIDDWDKKQIQRPIGLSDHLLLMELYDPGWYGCKFAFVGQIEKEKEVDYNYKPNVRTSRGYRHPKPRKQRIRGCYLKGKCFPKDCEDCVSTGKMPQEFSSDQYDKVLGLSHQETESERELLVLYGLLE